MELTFVGVQAGLFSAVTSGFVVPDTLDGAGDADVAKEPLIRVAAVILELAAVGGMPVLTTRGSVHQDIHVVGGRLAE